MSLNYIIGTRVLGSGGYGSVTLGSDKESGSPVAVKTVSRKHFKQTEVDILRTLNAPHVIKYRADFEVVNTANTEEATHCIVMDLVNGQDITQIYKTTRQTLSLPEIRSAAYQLFEFLAELEEKRIAYFDLKPANIIWQKPCRHLTVVDLGMAIEVSKVHTRIIAITTNYAPPDFILGKPYNHAFDLWSAGVTLYTLICGQSLFRYSAKLNTIENYNYTLQQIVAQMGLPTPNFLKDCAGSQQCFDDNFNLRNTWPHKNKSIHWSESLLKVLKYLGATEEEQTQWLDLMTRLLSYENRGSAKEHLQSALFESEMKVHLDYDPKCRCQMYIHPLERLKKPMESMKTIDIKEFDYISDFSVDKHCCIHLPDSLSGKYAIFLELNGVTVSEAVTLQKGTKLDIKHLQKELIELTGNIFSGDEGESISKRFKPSETH